MGCCSPKMESTSSSNDYLIVGGEVNTHSLVIASGQTIARGDVLQKSATTGKLSIIAAGAESKSFAIASYAVDASVADVNAEVYVEGRFDQAKVNLNGADLALVKAALSSSIQLVKRY